MNEAPVFKFAIREDLKDTGDRFIPSRGTAKATGWDVKAAFKNRESMVIYVGQHVKIPLGFRTFAPEGWWYELKPRSSTFGKKKLHSLYGTIDEDYEGELIFACQYLPNLHIYKSGGLPNPFNEYSAGLRLSEDICDLVIDFGEAIGQIIPVKRQEMVTESISNEEFDRICRERNAARGAGGFGSTRK